MPPRGKRKKDQQPEAELPDPVVFGPAGPAAEAALEELRENAPAAPQQLPAGPGPIALAVERDLAGYPPELAGGAIAATALRLAFELDSGIVMGRDAAGHSREIRLAMQALRELAPVGDSGDQTDEIRARRERRLGDRAGAG